MKVMLRLVLLQVTLVLIVTVGKASLNDLHLLMELIDLFGEELVLSLSERLLSDDGSVQVGLKVV